jgi:chromate reductase
MIILAISGSLQRRSSNTKLVEVARSLAPDGVEVVIYPSLAVVPPFNPDNEDSDNDAVTALRAAIAAADGVLIATPEYAHALPGTLKNALDWIVGSGELYRKRVAVMSAAPSSDRGRNAREMLERTLRAQGAEVISSSTVQVTPRDDCVIDAAAVAAVDTALRGLLRRPAVRSDLPHG